MPGTKEIHPQINSIGSTRKITKAMEMAAAKMRRAQERTWPPVPPSWCRSIQRRKDNALDFWIPAPRLQHAGAGSAGMTMKARGDGKVNRFAHGRMPARDGGRVARGLTLLSDYASLIRPAALDEINASPEYNDEVAAKMKAAIEEFKKNGSW